MNRNDIRSEQLKSLRRMGYTFLLLALLSAAYAFLFIEGRIEALDWLPRLEKVQQTTVYTFSGLFTVMSLFCLGSVWQKRSLIR